MKQRRKGFTIVELVVVIAVIGILAAVLIPTFSGLVQRANLSADQVAVKNMNTVITTSSILEGDLEDYTVVRRVLDEAGFNADNLVPTAKDHKFYWNKKHNIIMLVDCSNEDSTQWQVVYPENTPAKADFENTQIRSEQNFELSSLPLATMTKQEGANAVEITNEDAFEVPSGWLPEGCSNVYDYPVVLDTALKFTATETEEEARESIYKDWYVDFKITLSEDISVYLNNDVSFILAGQYESFLEDWIVISVNPGSPVSGKEFHLLGVMGLEFTYEDICTSVKEFNCGISIP